MINVKLALGNSLEILKVLPQVHWNQFCRTAFFNLTASIKKIEVANEAIKIVNKKMKTEHVSKFVNRKLIIDGV